MGGGEGIGQVVGVGHKGLSPHLTCSLSKSPEPHFLVYKNEFAVPALPTQGYYVNQRKSWLKLP